ncbi:hypothetical protein GKO28_00850 [Deefgea sp. CFH1-16]|nr:hypothetical protein [Deefgea sp. CFH1-16]
MNAPTQAKALNDDLEQAVLTGLGDFQADLTMKPTSPNPRKPLEMDHFSFQLKQKNQHPWQDIHHSATRRTIEC